MACAFARRLSVALAALPPSPASADPGAPIALLFAGIATVTVVSTTGALHHDLGLRLPEDRLLLQGDVAGQTATIGPYAKGTTLVFWLLVRDLVAGTSFTYTSDTARADVVADGPAAWLIHWDDNGDGLYGDEVDRVVAEPAVQRSGPSARVNDVSTGAQDRPTAAIFPDRAAALAMGKSYTGVPAPMAAPARTARPRMVATLAAMSSSVGSTSKFMRHP